MKIALYPVAAAILISASAFTVWKGANWKISEEYSIKFTSGHPDGVFRGLKGDIAFDAKNPKAGRFDVTVDVTTINTGNGMQNTHAKGAQWFDAEKFPQIRFTSTSVAQTAAGYQVTGILDMHGVKKEVAFPFTFKNNVFAGSFEVNRNDFGIGDPNHKSVPAKMKIDLAVPVTQ